MHPTAFVFLFSFKYHLPKIHKISETVPFSSIILEKFLHISQTFKNKLNLAELKNTKNLCQHWMDVLDTTQTTFKVMGIQLIIQDKLTRSNINKFKINVTQQTWWDGKYLRYAQWIFWSILTEFGNHPIIWISILHLQKRKVIRWAACPTKIKI